MSYVEKTQGGFINGVQADAMTYLVTHLGSRFALLGEEQRPAATNQLMNFVRLLGEWIDAPLTRFMMVRHRAQVGGRLHRNWESYSSFLLRACRVKPQQLISLFQPFNGQPPTNEQQISQIEMALRRMGHILNGTHMS